jgi:16S rRNA (guanine1207-N2)-methyltransferase
LPQAVEKHSLSESRPINDHDHDHETPPYPQESLLVEAVSEISGRRLLCTSPGLAQFAAAAARALPDAAVSCTYLDLYRASLALDQWRSGPLNLSIECAADLPDASADVVAFPFSVAGEAELTRDFLQAGHERLRIGGTLYVATDNPRDHWLRAQLRKLFRRLRERRSSAGTLYVGTKTEPLGKLKNFACEFAFRDRGRLIRAYSRPGVFSHRHIDPGARHLIDEMQIDAPARVLDIGCGAGVVALAAACRDVEIKVHAVDSNARAIECAKRGAALNALANLTAELNADGNYEGSGAYDLALANPPYYSGFLIARHFLAAGKNALRPGGTFLLVTKQPDWYAENIAHWFDDVSVAERKGYFVFRALRPD